VKGKPPFSWEESALDALDYDKFLGLSDWSLPRALDRLEAYNGVGYKRRGLPTPYLWAGTNIQKPGKFTSDGNFNPNVMDKQPGCAGILKSLNIVSVSAPTVNNTTISPSA
jgi:lysozyme family protein